MNEKDEIITAYITKYALTMGILEIKAGVCHRINSGMIAEVGAEHRSCYHGEGKEWHRTREEAVKRAEVMREKKIAALKTQIKKLERMGVK